jgi:ABC-type transport system substrate-binding protein
MDRRDFLSRASSGLVAGLAAASRPAVVGAAGAAETSGKRELVIAQPADLTSLDPHASTYSSDIRVALNVPARTSRSSCAASTFGCAAPEGRGQGRFS